MVVFMLLHETIVISLIVWQQYASVTEKQVAKKKEKIFQLCFNEKCEK